MEEKAVDNKNKDYRSEHGAELLVPAWMRDWKASIAIQKPVGEFSKDPLIALEQVN